MQMKPIKKRPVARHKNGDGLPQWPFSFHSLPCFSTTSYIVLRCKRGQSPDSSILYSSLTPSSLTWTLAVFWAAVRTHPEYNCTLFSILTKRLLPDFGLCRLFVLWLIANCLQSLFFSMLKWVWAIAYNTNNFNWLVWSSDLKHIAGSTAKKFIHILP